MPEPQIPAGVPAPVVFVGHGSPLNAIEDNPWSRAFTALGAQLPPPRAVLAISAHWYVPGTFTTENAAPPTLHDFGGFPAPLYEVQYPAPGDPALARRVAAQLAAFQATPSTEWGLDHGTWSVLLHLWPGVQVPVVQLSIDRRRPPAVHFEIGRALAPLRDAGVLILGSGNVTHNLRHALLASQTGDHATPAWAARFDTEVARALDERDPEWLVRALGTDDGRMSHPTPDHYLPLLYAAGAAFESAATVQFPITGFDLASLSMRTAVFR